MNYPTVLSPWFVVQRLGRNKQMEYFTPSEDSADKKTFTDRKSIAMIFTNIQSAARVAEIEVAEIRALTTKREAEEFDRHVSTRTDRSPS